MKSITVAIDYDRTWTADPEAFAAFANLLRRRGHRVIIVTARVSGHGEVERECGSHVDRVLFSGAGYKREHAVANGETVQIWIDDMPETIGTEPMMSDTPETPKSPRRKPLRWRRGTIWDGPDVMHVLMRDGTVLARVYRKHASLYTWKAQRHGGSGKATTEAGAMQAAIAWIREAERATP